MEPMERTENGTLLQKVSYGSTNSEEDDNIGSVQSLRSSSTRKSISKGISQSIRKMKELVASSHRASLRDVGGTCTMSNEIFNLIKNLVGAGAFGIPSGFASIGRGSRSSYTLVVAGGIILLMAVIFGYYFIIVGRVCKMTGSASYKEAWDKTAGQHNPLFKRMSFLIPLSIILMAGLANLAYSMILADTTRSLVARLGYTVSRNTCLICVTVFVLLPLCMVKKLSVLAPFSVSDWVCICKHLILFKCPRFYI